MQRNTKFLIAGAGVLALAIAGYAGFALTHRSGHMLMHGWMDDFGPRHGMMRQAEAFAELYDANKDGKISQDEINATRSQWLSDADANKDGALSLDEFQGLWLKMQRERMVRAFQKLDSNGDASISAAEYGDGLKNVVADLDTNRDGVLSREDLQGMRERMHKRMWMHGGDGDENEGSEGNP